MDVLKTKGEHFKLTTDEIVQRIKKTTMPMKLRSIKFTMKYMLADGIIKQFPEKFK